MIPKELSYTKEHEWIRAEGTDVVVGVTDYAQTVLGDVTFVDLPVAGKKVTKGEEACVVESVKAVTSIYAVADGTITEANAAVEDDPSLLNSDPYGEGWIYRLEPTDQGQLESLMNAEEYERFLQEVES